MLEKLKKKLKELKEDLSTQKIQSIAILKQRWDIGAEMGEKLKQKQKEKIKKLRGKNNE